MQNDPRSHGLNDRAARVGWRAPNLMVVHFRRKAHAAIGIRAMIGEKRKTVLYVFVFAGSNPGLSRRFGEDEKREPNVRRSAHNLRWGPESFVLLFGFAVTH
jgi:hypothetical protein